MAKAKKRKPQLEMPQLKKSEYHFALHAAASVLVPLVRSMFGVRARGSEKLPKSGAYILVGNHVTNVDALAVAYFIYVHLKRAPHFLAKEGLFRTPVIGSILRSAGQIPVYRSGHRNDEPLRAAFDFLKHGHSIAIFPEGTLTRDPELWPMRGKPGAIRLALEAGVPIYPLGQWGSEKILPQYGSKFRPGFWKKVDILVGDEIDLDRFRGRTLTPAELNEATQVVMKDITKLVAELRGEQAPARVWDPADHGQQATGNFKKEGK